MSKSSAALIIIVLIIIGVLVWGIIGSSQAAKIGTTCDFGVGKNSVTGETGSALCWQWHRNLIGQVGDNLNSLLGK